MEMKSPPVCPSHHSLHAAHHGRGMESITCSKSVHDDENIVDVAVNLSSEPVDEILKEPTREEKLLEAFPLTLQELDFLLKVSDDGVLNPGGFFTNRSLQQPRESDFSTIVEEIEKKILPPDFSDIVKVAKDHAFVLGTFDKEEQEQRQFLEGLVTLLGRRGQRGVLDLIFTYITASSPTTGNSVDTREILSLVRRLVVGSHMLFKSKAGATLEIDLEPPKEWLSSLNSTTISRREWVDWATWKLPLLYTSLSTFIHLMLFTNTHPFRPNIPSLHLPEGDSVFWNSPFDTIPITLAFFSSSLSGAVSC